MDIAEIRKKAKAQPKADDFVLESPAVMEPTETQEVTSAREEPAPADFSADTLLDLTTSDPTEGIDRLFAITEEFALTANGSSADFLESQAEVEDLISSQYLAFHLDDEEYALDIKRISEIIKVREFTDIPRAPEFVLGIISLRGVVVPVFDLRLRLNLGSSGLLPTSRIVVCQLEDVSVGFLVDSINQVVTLVDEDLEPPPGVLSGLDREMVTAIGRYEGRMIILLNLTRVLDADLN
jgi:purine-binding chemotaxis protein CheW